MRQGQGLGQAGRGTLHWPWGRVGEVKSQGQEVGVIVVEGKRRGE
jgi:hypothetical protein